MTLANSYGVFARPQLVRKLRAVGLDIVYHRAFGDYLYFYESGAGLEAPSEEEIEVLDFVGGFGANLVGHNHPAILNRVREVFDAQQPFHAQASVRGWAGLLAQRLSDRVGRTTQKEYVVTFGNSGAEAIEAALKHAELRRRVQHERRVAELIKTAHTIKERLRRHDAHISKYLLEELRNRFSLSSVPTIEELFLVLYRQAMNVLEQAPVFLAIERAFHGKTSGALQLTYRAEYQAPWHHLGPASFFLPVDDVEAITKTVARNELIYPVLEVGADHQVVLKERTCQRIAGCLVEPIQGEGGIYELSSEYLRALRRAADDAGFPLIMDEIQSGLGRVGTFLASEASGVRGDYYAFSKALGGGVAKISALLVEREFYIADFGLLHTSTFADDDLSSRVALQVLDLIEENEGELLERCQRVGRELRAMLDSLAARFPRYVRAVRGRGLMLGLELQVPTEGASPFLNLLYEQELLGFFISGYLLHEHRIRVAPTLSSRMTIRFEPSADLSSKDIYQLDTALSTLLEILSTSDTYRLSRFVVGRAREAELPRTSSEPHPTRAQIGFVHKDGGSSVRSSSVRAVGFLAHFLSPSDLREWEPAFTPFTDEECAQFWGRTRGVLEPFVAARDCIRSHQGDRVDVTVIGLPFLPDQAMEDMRRGEGSWVLDLIDQGVEFARQQGCTVLGFGGYTSILTKNCQTITASDLALTSGNSLTVAAALEGLFLAANRLSLSERRLGVVGATGNIGLVAATVAAEDVDSIVLVGYPRSKRRLVKAAEDLSLCHNRHGERLYVEVATDLSALKNCNLIVSASNSVQPIINPKHISDSFKVILSDVAVPQDVADEVRTLPQTLVLNGGTIQAPEGQSICVHGMKLDGGEIYGCLAETILMGCAGIGEHFSYGPLEAAKVRYIRDLAYLHGFKIQESIRDEG